MTYTCMECLDVNFMNIGAVLLGVLRDATWMVSGRKGNSLGQESQIGGPVQKKSKGAELRRKKMDYRQLFIELNQPVAAFGSCVGSGAL